MSDIKEILIEFTITNNAMEVPTTRLIRKISNVVNEVGQVHGEVKIRN